MGAARIGASAREYAGDEVVDSPHLDVVCVGVGLRTAVVDIHSAEVARDGTGLGGEEIVDGHLVASRIAHDCGEELWHW